MKWRKRRSVEPEQAEPVGADVTTITITIQELYTLARGPVADVALSAASSFSHSYADRWAWVTEKQRADHGAGLTLFALRGWWVGREDRRGAGWQPPANAPDVDRLLELTMEIFDAKSFELSQRFVRGLTQFQKLAVFEEVIPSLALGRYDPATDTLTLSGAGDLTAHDVAELERVAGDRQDVRDAIRTGTECVLWGLAIALAEHRCDPAVSAASVRGKANFEAGRSRFSSAAFAEALPLFDAALQDFRTAARPADQAEALYEMSGACQQLGRLDESVAHARQSLALFEQVSTPADLLKAMIRLGTALVERDDDLEAVGWFSRGLDIARQVDDDRAEATLLGKLSATLRTVGRLDEASEVAAKALIAYRNLGDRLNEAHTLNRLALLERNNSSDLAIQNWEQAAAIYGELGLGWERAATLNQLADAYSATGQIEKSITCYHEAAALAAKSGRPGDAAIILINVAEMLHDAGRNDEAQEALARAAQAAIEAGSVELATTAGSLSQLWQVT